MWKTHFFFFSVGSIGINRRRNVRIRSFSAETINNQTMVNRYNIKDFTDLKTPRTEVKLLKVEKTALVIGQLT